MLPWSVIPIAGCPSAAARAITSGTRAAPSSMENSVCWCRWVNEAPTGGLRLPSTDSVDAVWDDDPQRLVEGPVDELQRCYFVADTSAPGQTNTPSVGANTPSVGANTPSVGANTPSVGANT